ncbi:MULTISPECIES: hypothetical protein [Desulfococcus]|jgi:hypothetical protein|uniref:Uncharacterized protein n=1 Tax=Desulfococcus multivorans DSM 2059 TaxID=1121405 RepID=S7V2D3_DESML|nr:hypothetical protein [Desulfococcus multivorans]AOY57681.1 conserved uncharacterized protein [Desulfococcus multivorans]AQV00082.1 hypothetical protein B2D07_04370 [Desulfococcus multivorans]EPR38763.1 hypothetical protein dsmv_0173 [Desulfococcus multivorans DSM 2059]MDX9818206.1 hypothetical protein [Desulfococcus multivorans]SJZ78742.1 hypothetical protein SAMN02745446_01663 [Desulfococcus multivorans DSM 2059]
MNRHLQETLLKIAEDFKSDIVEGSRFYIEVDIGKWASRLGYDDIYEQYGQSHVIVPIKRPQPGMKVRIDGRTFVNYAQFESGIAAPAYIARETDLPYRTYIPNDSMIRNFT